VFEEKFLEPTPDIEIKEEKVPEKKYEPVLGEKKIITPEKTIEPAKPPDKIAISTN
jgi:hypothetical protein